MSTSGIDDGSARVPEQAITSLRALRATGLADAAIARDITRAWRGLRLTGPDATFDDVRHLAWLLGVWLPERDARWLVDLAVFVELAASDEGSLDLAFIGVDAAVDTEVARIWALSGDALTRELAEGRARLARRDGLLDLAGRDVGDLVREVPGLPGSGVDGDLARTYFDSLDEDGRLELATLLTQADTELRAENYRAAVQSYSTAIARAPEYHAPRVLRASILVDAGYVNEAASDIARARQLAPGSPSMLQVTARIHLVRGEGDAALAALDEALDGDPDSAQILSERGFVRLQLGMPAGATADFASAALREPGKSENHFYLGAARLQEGDTAAALDAFDRALELKADTTEYLQARGTARSQLNDGPGALADFEREIELDPLSIKARLSRAVVLLEMLDRPEEAYAEAFVVDVMVRALPEPDEGDLDQASGLLHETALDTERAALNDATVTAVMSTFEKLLDRGALQPGFALLDALDAAMPETQSRTQTLRGLAYERSGNRGEAASAYRKALVSDPRQLAAWQQLARVVWQEHDAAAAAEVAREALQHHPNAASLHGLRGLALGQTGRTADALEAFTDALRLVPEDANLQLHHATTLGRLGRYEEALRELRPLAELQPDSADVQYGLGTVLQRLKRYPEAIAALQRAVALRPGHPESHHALACAFAAIGARAEALEAVARAVRLNPAIKATLRADGELAALMGDPEFQRLVS